MSTIEQAPFDQHLATATEPCRVVLADDHPLYRRGVAWALISSRSYEIVAEADNGADALRAIREHRPDLAVLDVRMPELDGLEVVHALRLDGDTTPVVLLSAFDEAQIVLAGMIEGAAVFLNKDLARHTLVQAIDNVVAEQHATPAAAVPDRSVS